MEKELTRNQRIEVLSLYRKILTATAEQLSRDDKQQVKLIMKQLLTPGVATQSHTTYTINPLIKWLNTIYLTIDEIGMGRSVLMSVLTFVAVRAGIITTGNIEKQFGKDISVIVRGLIKANELYTKNVAVETENFRKLLLTFAEDIRVVFILIAEHVYIMRNLEKYDPEHQQKIAREAAYLYAPMAHRMGLYRLKTELEDLSLRWISPDIYFDIERKLKETKDTRDKYIADFIAPLKKQLTDAGFSFSIKGRTKSIYSIWNKIKKKGTPFENIYDIFAIRVILNSPPEKEKAECWQVYSIVTDKYQPNPKRLRDWLSIPKSNGYESLHTTVMGPEGKWVEVQIRTKRMDEVAEKGLAAHWKYKGIKGEDGMDEWLKNLREILENPEKDDANFIDDFKLDLYDDDVFIFTPNGELKKLKQGSTVLDFAFNIHSDIGCHCVGAKVNGKNVPIRHVLNNGDQVEILTSTSQNPKEGWLDIVVTAKAKTKVKQALKDTAMRFAEDGKETLERKLKNWKMDIDDSAITHCMRKLGYKTVTAFYQGIGQEEVNLLELRDMIDEYRHADDNKPEVGAEGKTAKNFVRDIDLNAAIGKSDVLVIDKDLKGIDYKLAKCCNPVYGDKVFGFVSAGGGIKIHRADCPNAPQMISRYGYRIVQARWAGKGGNQYPVNMTVKGKDDIGIVTNITSLISSTTSVTLRSISVDTKDGIFEGHITLLVEKVEDFDMMSKKIAGVKGVTEVIRN